MTTRIDLKMILTISLFLFGCAKTNSDNIKTSGFYANYSLVGNNINSVTCSASFSVSQNGTVISLSDGDSVTCNGTAMAKSTWTPSTSMDEYLEISFSPPTNDQTTSPCPYSLTEGVGPPETGSFTWSRTNQGQAGTCNATIDFNRHRIGTMPAGLDGRIRSEQRTSISISLTD